MRTSFKIKTIALVLFATQLSFAQEAAKPAAALVIPDPVAKVGDKVISKADYDMLIEFLSKRGQPTPQNEAQVKQLVENYAQQMALLEKAKASGIETDADYLLQKKFTDNDLIINSFVAKLTKDIKVSDDELKSTYDAEAKRIKDLPLEEKREYNAAHIVVADKKLADQIIKDLRAKKISFEDAAKKYGKDESAKNGGNLGWFTAKMMIPDFMKGLKGLKPGLATAPIKTEFGYHIVNLIDVRVPVVAPFDKVKDQLKQQVELQKVQEKVKEEVSSIAIQNLVP